jgi:hypothetical protein
MKMLDLKAKNYIDKWSSKQWKKHWYLDF